MCAFLVSKSKNNTKTSALVTITETANIGTISQLFFIVIVISIIITTAQYIRNKHKKADESLNDNNRSVQHLWFCQLPYSPKKYSAQQSFSSRKRKDRAVLDSVPKSRDSSFMNEDSCAAKIHSVVFGCACCCFGLFSFEEERRIIMRQPKILRLCRRRVSQTIGRSCAHASI